MGLYSSLSHPFKSKIPKALEVGCFCVLSNDFIQCSQNRETLRKSAVNLINVGVCFLASEVSYHFAVFHVKVKATVDISTVAGKGSSSAHVRADGKDRVKLDAEMAHSLQREHRTMGLRINLSQSLLPSSTDLHVNMTANMSSDRCVYPPVFQHLSCKCYITFIF